MENHTFTQTKTEKRDTYIRCFLHPDLIGDWDFTGWKMYVTKEREIDALPYDDVMKDYQKKMLKKAKYGIGVDELGGVIQINDIEQVIEGKILPPWPACMIKYLQML